MEKKVLWKCLDKMRLTDEDIMVEIAIHHCNDPITTLVAPTNFLVNNNHMRQYSQFVKMPMVHGEKYARDGTLIRR